MKLITALLFCFLIYGNCCGQVFTKDRSRFLKEVLSDTVVTETVWFIAIKIKFSAVDTERIYTDLNGFLYDYFRNRYGWNGEKYRKEMEQYIVTNKAMIVDNDGYFKTRGCMPISECKCMYPNTDVEGLVYQFDHRDFGAPVTCFVSRFFDKNILVGFSEANVFIGRSLEMRERAQNKYNEDGSPK